jgi:hypothetical protein
MLGRRRYQRTIDSVKDVEEIQTYVDRSTLTRRSQLHGGADRTRRLRVGCGGRRLACTARGRIFINSPSAAADAERPISSTGSWLWRARSCWVCPAIPLRRGTRPQPIRRSINRVQAAVERRAIVDRQRRRKQTVVRPFVRPSAGPSRYPIRLTEKPRCRLS